MNNSNDKTPFKSPIRIFTKGSKLPAGWVPATKEENGQTYWLKNDGRLGKVHAEEYYDVFIGFGNQRRIVNHAGKLPTEGLEPYFKARYSYFNYIEDKNTLEYLAKQHPTIAFGTQTDFKKNGEYETAKAEYYKYKVPYQWKLREDLSPNQIKENTIKANLAKDRKDTMFAKMEGLFGTISEQATTPEEVKATSSKSVAETTEELSKNR